MPPNYNISLNPSRRFQLNNARIVTVSIILLPFKFVLLIPLLSLNVWRKFVYESVSYGFSYFVKIPRKVVQLPFLFGNGVSLMQRVSLRMQKVKVSAITSFSKKNSEVLSIPTKADYIIDRYLIHSPVCILNKFLSENAQNYEFKGIYLSSGEGFEDYLLKWQSENQDFGNYLFSEEERESDDDEMYFPPVPGTRVKEPVKEEDEVKEDLEDQKAQHNSFEQKVADLVLLESRENAKREQSSCDEVSPILVQMNKSDDLVTSGKNDKLAALAAKGNNLVPILSPKPVLATCPFTPRTLDLFKQQPIRPSRFVNLKLNGKQIKIKINPKPKLQQLVNPDIEFSKTFYQSISENQIEYLNAVKGEIKSLLPSPGYDDGSLSPIVLRLSWHCCATYDKYTETGGSNGSTMRFLPEITDEGNTGLDIARSALETVKQKYPKMSYADLWTLAGCVAIEDMEGPTIKWKPGRYDCRDNRYVPENGRLPFGNKDSNHVRETFTRMGFSDQETVALLGCHGLGRCHKRYSGWEGKWTSNPIKFDNDFFKVLIEQEWELGVVPETGREQYFNPDKSLMMLNTDLELIRDLNYKIWVQAYANDEELFVKDFSKLFEKLLELGIKRDIDGKVIQR